MQIPLIWRFLEAHMTRTPHHSKKKKSAVHGLPLTQAAVGGFLFSGMFKLVGMLRLSMVRWRACAKSIAVRVCVTMVSRFPASGSAIIKTSITPLRTYSESTFSGQPASQGIRVSSTSWRFISSIHTTGCNGSKERC